MRIPIKSMLLLVFCSFIYSCANEYNCLDLSCRGLDPLEINTSSYVRHFDRTIGQTTVPVTRVSIPANSDLRVLKISQPIHHELPKGVDAFAFDLEVNQPGITLRMALFMQDRFNQNLKFLYTRYDDILIRDSKWNHYRFRFNEFNDANYETALPLYPPQLKPWQNITIRLTFMQLKNDAFSFDLGPMIVYKEPSRFRFF